MSETGGGADPVQQLAQLRGQIDRIDEEIIALLQKRSAVVDAAARLKGGAGEGVRSESREQEVLAARRERAQSCGLSPDLAEDLFRRILREGYRAGEQLLSGTPSSARTVVIVGGGGGMGRLFHQALTRVGLKVRILESGDWERAGEILAGADAVMVSVPIDVTAEVMRRLAPLLDPHCLFCDLTSVKSWPLELMLECHPGPVIGLHPMFGPDSTLVKQVIVTCPGRERQAAEFLLEALQRLGARLVECTPEEHDRAMGIIQALRHFTTYCYGRFLLRRAPNLQKMLELSSPIYHLELMMVGRLFAQDPRLYADIIMASRDNLELLQDYAGVLGPEFAMVANGDREEFVRRFREVQEFFGPLARQFLGESGRLLQKVKD